MIKISVPQFAIIADRVPNTDLNLSTEIKFEYSDEAMIVACTVTFSFNAEGVNILLKLACRCDFMIHPEDWNAFKREGDMNIPTELLEYLAMQTIGTSRGVLYCKTEGTDFNSLMIPPLNVREIMKDNHSDKI